MCLAIPGKIVSISDGKEFTRMGKVDFGGVKKDVSLAYLSDAKVGDYVIVHVGFALSKVDEEEAKKIFEYYQEMNQFQKEELG